VIGWGSFSGAGNHDAPRGAQRKPQTDLASDPEREKQGENFHRRTRRQTEPTPKSKKVKPAFRDPDLEQMTEHLAERPNA